MEKHNSENAKRHPVDDADIARTVSIGTGEAMEKKTLADRDVDEALNFLESHAEIIDFDNVDEKKLMRRVDWMVIPLCFGCYFLQYSDKTLSTFALQLVAREDDGQC